MFLSTATVSGEIKGNQNGEWLGWLAGLAGWLAGWHGLRVALAGCANTGGVQMDQGTYLISIRDAQLGFGPLVTAEADAYEQANAYCASKGETVKTIKLKRKESGFAKPAAIMLDFSCVR